MTDVRELEKITPRSDTRDVLAHAAKSFRKRGGSPPGLLNIQPGMLYQDMFGRIPHGQQSDAIIGEDTHRQIELTRRAMDSMGIDYTVAFPTPMLLLGMHPQAEVEVALGRVQSLADRGAAATRAAHQGDDVSAVQRSGRLR